MKMKMRNRSHRYDANKYRPRHGPNYKKCLSMMVLICIKQHLSNNWSSIHEKVKQQRGRVKKKALLIKKGAYWVWWYPR